MRVVVVLQVRLDRALQIVFFQSLNLKQHAWVRDQPAAKYHHQQLRNVAKTAGTVCAAKDWSWVSLKDNLEYFKDMYLSRLYMSKQPQLY